MADKLTQAQIDLLIANVSKGILEPKTPTDEARYICIYCHKIIRTKGITDSQPLFLNGRCILGRTKHKFIQISYIKKLQQ